jgi:hypothetical protein
MVDNRGWLQRIVRRASLENNGGEPENVVIIYDDIVFFSAQAVHRIGAIAVMAGRRHRISVDINEDGSYNNFQVSEPALNGKIICRR